MPAERRTTQAAHPWRATARTVFQALIALSASWAVIVEAAGIDGTLPWVAGSLAAAAGATRVMALPQVEELLARFVPWLAADPASSAWHAGKLPDRQG